MWKHTRFAGWMSVTNAEEMIMEACCKGQINFSGAPSSAFNSNTSPVWPNFKKTWDNNFEKTMQYFAGFGDYFPDIVLEHFNFHFKVDYRGRIAERYITE